MGAGVRAVLGDASGEVAVFGSLNADLTVRTERFPKPGETISGEDLVILPGGKSANQAVQAGLLGARVRMIGAVGADGHGDLLIESLQRAGVDTSAVQREDVATGTAIITVDGTGDNTIVVSPGANGTVDASTAQRRRDVIGEARVLGLCMEVSPEAVEAAARIAHDAGTRVVFNNSPFHPVLSAGLLEAIDVLVVNEHELADMLKPGTSGTVVEPECERADDATDWSGCARRLAAMGIPSAVVTLG
ncbi:ribokinase, partial [Actinomyces oris]|uniref:ribokinase n=1 Tax=Actinomyces oris TaxID=544580 RepID=UPI0028EE9F4C